jgi:succinoglycan biosynthesis transport protein ExoP
MQTKQGHKSSKEVSFDLADLVGFLWQKKGRIVLSSASIIFAGIYYISGLPLIYSASSRIVLGDNEPSFSLPSVVPNFGYGGETILDTYIEFIRSRQFIGGVLDDMELTNAREFRYTGGFHSADEMREYAIDVLLGGLKLNKIGDTYLLKITFESKSPKIAAEIANFIGPAFFVYHAKINTEKANDTSKWLNDQLGALENKLVTAEDSLQAYIEENQLIGANSQIEFARAEILILLEEKLAIEKTLSAVKASLSQIDSAVGDAKELKGVDYIMKHPMMINIRSNLLTNQQAFARVSKRYKNKHHRYIEANAAIKKLESEEQQLIDQLIAGLRQNVSTYEQRLASLKLQMNKAEQKHSELSRYELQLTKLRREIDSTQTLYEVFVSRLQETQMLKDLGKTNQFSVVDYASIPIYPTKPRKVMLLVVVCLFAVVLSSGMWLLLHLISDKQTRLRNLLINLDVTVLARVSKYKKVKQKKGVIGIAKKDKNYEYSESIRSLRAEISYGTVDAPIRSIAVARVKCGKTKTNIVIDLAESFGHLEKSILIDADMRQPHVGTEYGMEQLTPGLTNFIGRRFSFSDSHYREAGSQLSIMPTGAVPSDPLLYLSKPRFAGFVKKLSVLYEHVIIEAPEVNLYSDIMVIAKLVDGIVLLCDLETTDSHELLEAVLRLRESRAPLLGVVFENAKNVRSKLPKSNRGQALIKKVIDY